MAGIVCPLALFLTNPQSFFFVLAVARLHNHVGLIIPPYRVWSPEIRCAFPPTSVYIHRGIFCPSTNFRSHFSPQGIWLLVTSTSFNSFHRVPFHFPEGWFFASGVLSLLFPKLFQIGLSHKFHSGCPSSVVPVHLSQFSMLQFFWTKSPFFMSPSLRLNYHIFYPLRATNNLTTCWRLPLTSPPAERTQFLFTPPLRFGALSPLAPFSFENQSLTKPPSPSFPPPHPKRPNPQMVRPRLGVRSTTDHPHALCACPAHAL